MIEPALFFGLGFFAAGLLTLVIIPLIHARAVRLTQRRLENAGPLSYAEIQADKDRLRAEAALSIRKLEQTIEQLRQKGAGQLAEIGKLTTALNALGTELAERTTAAVSMEARERATAEALEQTEQRLKSTAETLRETEKALAESRDTVSRLSRESEERAVALDSQRIELVAMNTQLATLKDRISDLEERLKAAESQRDGAIKEIEDLRTALASANDKIGQLQSRAGDLQSELQRKAAAAESLAQRLGELEPRHAEQGQALSAIALERDGFKERLAAARILESELHEQLQGLAQQKATEARQWHEEKASLEALLERAREERTRLYREIAALRRSADEMAETERRETAFLRDRISDVAAEVAHLTVTLEGADSPIVRLIAEDASAPRPHAGAARGDAPAGAPAGPTLAERVRMLQTRKADATS